MILKVISNKLLSAEVSIASNSLQGRGLGDEEAGVRVSLDLSVALLTAGYGRGAGVLLERPVERYW